MSSQPRERGKPIDPRVVNEDALARQVVQLKEEIKKLSDENQTMKRECKKRNDSENFLQREVSRLEGELRQTTADRDNWRKQALNENARLEGVLERIRTFVNAQSEEDRIARLNMDAFNAKQAAFKALISCGNIPMPEGGRG